MREDYFNPETYVVIDRITGEEVDMAIFIEKASASGWEKAFAETLCDYIKCADGKAVDLLAYIISNRTGDNLINGTQRELAKKSGVSTTVVNKTIAALKKKDLIKQIRSGCYMVSPKIIRHGGKIRGSMMLRLWGEIK